MELIPLPSLRNDAFKYPMLYVLTACFKFSNIPGTAEFLNEALPLASTTVLFAWSVIQIRYKASSTISLTLFSVKNSFLFLFRKVSISTSVASNSLVVSIASSSVRSPRLVVWSFVISYLL